MTTKIMPRKIMPGKIMPGKIMPVRPFLFGLSLFVLSVALPALPAMAQSETVTRGTVKVIDNRLQNLESQMKAVQRKVFPDAGKNYFTPEITAPSPAGPGSEETGDSTTNPLVNLMQRVDGLEQQQRQLTGRIEELQFQLKEQQLTLQKFREDAEFRLNTLEGKPTEGKPTEGKPAETAATSAGAPTNQPAPAAKPAPTPAPTAAPKPAAPPAPKAETATPEARYRAGRALYTEKKYKEAAASLQAFVKDNPKSPFAADAQFYAGRAFYASDQTAEAAKAFLNNYQTHPKSNSAPNSLLWLSRSLIRMNANDQACRVLNELKASYPEKITGPFADDVKATRSKAKCAA